MDLNLTQNQARVIGCLLEKETTTPEQYPLSLNSLTNACNQKSNREPVLSLDEITVQSTLDELVKRHLVVEKTGFGSRISKYQHRFCNTELGSIQLTEQERAIICVMLLRGPQTPGELRSRTGRLAKFRDAQEIEAGLQQLAQREGGAFVIKLQREAGKREVRYAHLFCDEIPTSEIESISEDQLITIDNSTNAEMYLRITALEEQVTKLQLNIENIQRQLNPDSDKSGEL